MRLTDKQIEALTELAREDRGSWNFGSTTVSKLRKHGYAVNKTTHGGTKLSITDAGREALAAHGGGRC